MFIKNNLLSRYLTKEVFSAMMVLTILLLLIFLSQQCVRLLSYAAAGKVAANIIMQVIGFEIPYLLAYLLPIGFYLGIIWVYGVLYTNNELRIMQACGFGIKRLVGQLSLLTGLVMMIVVILMLWINPWIAKEKDRIIKEGQNTGNIINTILPGRFQATKDGKRVIYIERLSRGQNKKANNVFIADQKENTGSDEINKNRWTVLSASVGYQSDKLSQAGDHYLIAEYGNRYEGTPGENDYKIIQFNKYSVRVGAAPITTKRIEQEAIPTAHLLKTYESPNNAAELQWRLAMPISVVILMLLAVPISQVKPRQGRYVQLLVAILIYIIYVNLLFLGRNWIELKIIPVGLGLWWVHALFLMLAYFLYQYRLRQPI